VPKIRAFALWQLLYLGSEQFAEVGLDVAVQEILLVDRPAADAAGNLGLVESSSAFRIVLMVTS
jgi:hypothetical protein